MKLASKKISTATATYSIGKSIGDGGAGVVYSALTEDKSQVALKVLRPKTATREKLKRFRNELNYCLRNRDAAIVTVIDHGIISTDEGQASFYVMPHYSSTLRKLLGSKLAPERAMQLSVNLLDCVETAHLHETWHRDLKPENFLHDPKKDRLVLADFGAAHFHEDYLLTKVETSANTRLANMEYAAPEQRKKGASVDSRADLFALGLMIHELFTGVVPHGQGYTLIKDVSPRHAFLDEIIEWLIQNDPSKRPVNVDEVRTKLAALQVQAGVRQRLDDLTDTVVSRSQASDPLISDPPRLLGSVDFNNQTLTLPLSTIVSDRWIESFYRIHHPQALVGIRPKDFHFAGDTASLTFPTADPAQFLIQEAVNEFKRYLDLASSDYAARIEALMLEHEENERRALARALDVARKRSEVLRQLKV